MSSGGWTREAPVPWRARRPSRSLRASRPRGRHARARHSSETPVWVSLFLALVVLISLILLLLTYV
ncbi:MULTISPECIES: hypothetical protein [Saccharothrix]|uniref:hypothetical protein n=1 Tax=Saccharothrix TaxID=2071 RepID=UPI00116148F4|nr:hypothetical protein [Saccharothrix sp. CB00851]